jgi:outer membrane protein TolC
MQEIFSTCKSASCGALMLLLAQRHAVAQVVAQAVAQAEAQPVTQDAAQPAAEGGAAGAAYQPPDFILEPPGLPEGTTPEQVRSLSVADAIQLAARNNLGVVLAKTELGIARAGIGAARGAFEPTLVAGYAHRWARTPPSTIFEGSSTNLLLEFETDEWRAGYQQRTALGTTLQLDFTSVRTESSLNSAVLPLLYRSVLELRLTQPLLRGFAFDTDVPRAEVLRAELASERAQRDVEVALLSIVRDTEQAYWDLFQALKSHEVQQGAVRLAEQQLALTRRQIDSGVRPPSDLINAEGTLAQRELELVRAQYVSAQAMDQLRFLLNLPKHEWSEPLLPRDRPEFERLSIDFEPALAQALARRPELLSRELEVSRAELDVRVAKANRLPALDASASYGVLGQRPGYGDALEQLSSNDARVWSAALNFSWTPFNEAASAELEARELGRRAAHAGREAAELALRLELRAALRGLEAAERSVRAAGKFRSLAERSLDAEQRRFLNGTSDNFYVAQRQSDLAGARLAELAALVQHRKAATALRAAMGVLLEDRGVVLQVRER